MDADDLRPGLVLTNAAHASRPRTCTVTQVNRTPWKHRVTRFWVRWEGTDADAEHMPGDAIYLDPVND